MNSQKPLPHTPSWSHASPSTHSTRGGCELGISGLQAEEHIDHGEAVHRIMGTHETLAWITLGTFGVLALWRIVRENRMGGTERAFSRGLSLVGLEALLATAIYGGKLVFEHAAGIPTPVLEAELHERAEGHHHHGAQGQADEHGAGDHDHATPSAMADSATTDSAAATPATDSAKPAGHTHTHAPGTPPHKD